MTSPLLPFAVAGVQHCRRFFRLLLSAAALPYPPAVAGVSIAVALILLCALGLMSLAVRRLHDIGLSGWWILAYLAVAKIVPAPLGWPSLAPSPGSVL